MLAVYSDKHRLHAPEKISARGATIAAQEAPSRAEELIKAIREGGHRVIAPRDFGLAPIERVHTLDYLEFLRTAYARWQQVRSKGLQAAETVQAHAFSLSRMPHHRKPCSFPANVPHYIGGGYAPIEAGTYDAAVSSAHCALEAAAALRSGERLAYALCRPPGHHAYTDMAGGYCYLNNCAIAAQQLLQHHDRVGILDIDVHHGNGTQQIFYERADVLTISVHADPDEVYPFACGYADETGAGAGAGFNLNLPLPRGAGDVQYVAAIQRATRQIAASGCAAVIVALGFDAYVGDPSAAMTVTTQGFAAAAAAIADLRIPTLLVQEGGYDVAALGKNLDAFLQGFMSR